MTINADTHLYGILGNPVRHSLSPLIHNAQFERLQINAVYAAFEVGPESIGLALEGVRSLGIRGVNLTIPFKESAMDFVDEVPEDVDRCIGAINTVVNRHGKLIGYNTDAPGFLTALHEDLQFNPEGKTCLVLGAGGAARGMASALARAHADRILVHNRTHERAVGLAEYLSPFFPENEIEALGSTSDLREERIDLVVNATSCGMKGNADLPLDLEVLARPAFVYDSVYAPAETPFLKEAKRLGWSHANGLGMLAAQAALSFELWTGKKDGVRESMLETLKKCRF